MTRVGVWSLFVLFGALTLGGALLALPTPGELGVRETLSCEELLLHPREVSSVRLTGCEVDLGDYGVSVGEHPRVSFQPEVLPPHAAALRHRLERSANAEARDRYRARHAAELHATIDVEGELSFVFGEDASDAMIVRPARRKPALRAFGVALVLLGLPLLILAAFTDRRWRNRSDALAGGGRPKRF